MSGDPPVWLLVAVGAALFVGVLLLIVAVARKRGGGASSSGKEKPCPNCKRIVPEEWPKCRFCKTALREQNGQLQFLSGPMQGQVLPLDREVARRKLEVGDVIRVGTSEMVFRA